MNLVRRQIIKEDSCYICQCYPKNVIHAIWECNAAQDVWAGSSVRTLKCGGEMEDFLQLFQFMVAKLSEEELEVFLVQCWQIWHQRNLLLHGGKIQDPRQLNRRAIDYLMEYREA